MELAELFVELPRIGREAKARTEEDPWYNRWEGADQKLANDAYQALYRILEYYNYLLSRNQQKGTDGQILQAFMRELLASCRPACRAFFLSDKCSAEEIWMELWKELYMLGVTSQDNSPPDKAPRVLAREICISLGEACLGAVEPASEPKVYLPRKIGWEPKLVVNNGTRVIGNK